MISKYGVYYDLTKSTFTYKVQDTGMKFIFSSDLHMLKFQDQFQYNRKENNLKLKARYRYNIELNVLHDLMLYKRIESRGFLVLNKEGERLCQENLILSGEKATLKL